MHKVGKNVIPQYFEVKIEYIDITAEEFDIILNNFGSNLEKLFAESKYLESEIKSQLNSLKYEG